MVKPVSLHVRRKALFHFSRQQIASRKNTILPAAQRARVPHQTARHDEILRRTITTLLMRRFPQPFSRDRVKSRLLAIAARIQNRVARDEHARAVVEFEQLPLRRRLTRPLLVAGFRVEQHELVAIVENDPLFIRRKRQWSNLGIVSTPKHLPARHIDCYEITRLLVPVKLRLHALLVAGIQLGSKLLQHVRTRIHHRVEDPVHMQNFLRPLRLRQLAQSRPRRRIKHTHGTIDLQRHKYFVPRPH